MISGSQAVDPNNADSPSTGQQHATGASVWMSAAENATFSLAGANDPVQSSHPSLTPFRHETPQGGLSWLTSLADLCLLMLTFCILVFSMSVPDQEAWQSLVQGLSTRPDPVLSHPVDASSPEFAIDAIEAPPGDDLRYLEALLQENSREGGPLASVQSHWNGQVLTLVMEISGPIAASPVLKTLAEVLERVPNQVVTEILVPSAQATGADGAQHWAAAVEDSNAVAVTLANNGYDGKISSLARMAGGQDGGSHDIATKSSVRTVTLIVLPEAKE